MLGVHLQSLGLIVASGRPATHSLGSAPCVAVQEPEGRPRSNAGPNATGTAPRILASNELLVPHPTPGDLATTISTGKPHIDTSVASAT
jgi:hypothetical protein